MPEPSNVVRIPKAPRDAFNKERPASKLLQAQIVHHREALIKHVEEVVAIIAIDPASVRTEGEAAAYIQRSTALLHPHATRGGRE